MRPILPTPKFLAIIILAVFTVFITWKAKSLENRQLEFTDASALVNKKAPDFSLQTLDDKIISLADYRGRRKVVVAYWATWCPPCREEMMTLADFYRKYHKDSSNFEILAISTDSDRYLPEAFAKRAKLSFPILLDPDLKVMDIYSVQVIPSLFIVDLDGDIVYGKTGLNSNLETDLLHQQLGIKFPVQ